jgi:hypothetical protein
VTIVAARLVPADTPTRRPGRGRMVRGGSRALGATLGLVTAAFYFLGAGRALDYDGSVTTGLFVKHGSLLDVFRSVYAFNNQPYFSFVEHVVWDGGGRSEAWLRGVPIVAGAAVVAVVAAWSARRWGLAAGLIAGTTVATNPMFASLARSVRGYSLMVFGCTAATLMFVDIRESSRSMSRSRSVGYVAALGVAIGIQFYAVLVLAAHLVMLLRDGRFDDAWRRRITAVVAVGALPYIGMAKNWSRRRGRGPASSCRRSRSTRHGRSWVTRRSQWRSSPGWSYLRSGRSDGVEGRGRRSRRSASRSC